MRILALSVYLLITVFSWGQTENKFARVLTYATTLEIVNDDLPAYAKDYLNQKYGDSLHVVYDTLGNIRMNYFRSGKNGIAYYFYNATNHTMYARWKGIDTLYYYDASVNDYTLDSMKTSKTIDGSKIECYSHNPEVNGAAIQEFYFVEDSMYVNPDLYADFKDFFFHSIISESRKLPVKTVIKSNDIIIRRVLTNSRIIANPKKSLFEDNGKLPLKKY
ncbi:MAG: hypothetical protein HWE22_14830 [Flavobacteriales bacterium]|nr:hypothetical protein [Flavobacteriales bacterium]